jgi:hypothetical protein
MFAEIIRLSRLQFHRFSARLTSHSLKEKPGENVDLQQARMQEPLAERAAKGH